MIHEIFPHKFDLSFKQPRPQAQDVVLNYHNDLVLLKNCGDSYNLPFYDHLINLGQPLEEISFLFSISTTNFYISQSRLEISGDFVYQPVNIFRDFKPSWQGFAGITGYHLSVWLSKNRHCGRCATQTLPSQTERALICPACGLVIYPTISPVVIVALTDGDRLLMTRYAQGAYRNLALVAGFVEIGETLEEAVKREVREEVGLEIKNIRYYKSQPWAFSQSLLTGFFADLDGSDQVELDHNELSEAIWLQREDIPAAESTMSLTWNMIEAFRHQKF